MPTAIVAMVMSWRSESLRVMNGVTRSMINAGMDGTEINISTDARDLSGNSSIKEGRVPETVRYDVSSMERDSTPICWQTR